MFDSKLWDNCIEIHAILLPLCQLSALWKSEVSAYDCLCSVGSVQIQLSEWIKLVVRAMDF